MAKKILKKDIFLRNCKEEDFKELEKIADTNGCSLSRAFDLLMEAYKKGNIKITREMKISRN